MRRVAALAVVSTVLVGSPAAMAAGQVRQAAAKQASPAACPAWDGVQPANSAFAFVAGVAVLPDCDAWAVGGTNNPIRMLIEKFAGSSWTRQPVSVPKFKTELFSVAATSTDNAWAVGNQHPPGQNIQDLIMGWTGSTWAPATPPAIPGASSSLLTGVAATSASNAWAVGNYGIGHVHQTLILHWNGTAWAKVPSPDPSGLKRGSYLTSVTADSPDDAWAAGYYNSTKFAGAHTLTLHWNGKKWSWVPSPTPTTAHQGMLFGVAATSARNAWAVGYTTKPSDSTVILHWNGRTWSQQRSPNPPNINGPPHIFRLDAVAATSAGNAWAVGYLGPSDWMPEILHWNGKAWRWKSVPPEVPNYVLYAVAASPAGGVWAAGFYNPNLSSGIRPPDSFMLRWNGTSWQA